MRPMVTLLGIGLKRQRRGAAKAKRRLNELNGLNKLNEGTQRKPQRRRGTRRNAEKAEGKARSLMAKS
jgi:hypothetical protein